MDAWQEGDPASLARLTTVVGEVTYKHGWQILLRHMERGSEHLAGSKGWTLIVAATLPDSRPEARGADASPQHWFAVPPTSWSREGWERWIFECVLEVETHEAMEFFRVNGKPVFYPDHGPEAGSPYTVERR